MIAALHIVGVLALMFAGGLLTSFAEYKFDYNLYAKVFHKAYK